MLRVLLWIGLAGSLAAAEFTGYWSGTIDANGFPPHVFLTLNQNGHEVSGTLATVAEPMISIIGRRQIQGGVADFGLVGRP